MSFHARLFPVCSCKQTAKSNGNTVKYTLLQHRRLLMRLERPIFVKDIKVLPPIMKAPH